MLSFFDHQAKLRDFQLDSLLHFQHPGHPFRQVNHCLRSLLRASINFSTFSNIVGWPTDQPTAQPTGKPTKTAYENCMAPVFAMLTQTLLEMKSVKSTLVYDIYLPEQFDNPVKLLRTAELNLKYIQSLIKKCNP